MTFDINLDPSKTVDPIATHGVFDAVIVKAEYGMSEAGKTTADGKSIEEGYQLKLTLKSPKWESDQFIWLPFADKAGKAVAAKGSKWMNFLQMLAATGAETQINKSGTTKEEVMSNICVSLTGMNFTFEEFLDYPLGVNIVDYLKARVDGTLQQKLETDWKNNRRTKSQINPVKFLGRVAVSGAGGFSSEKVNKFS